MKYIYATILLLFVSAITFGQQLAPFTISIDTVSETCDSNGQLEITPNGLTPGTITIYAVYKLPDQTNAVRTTENTTIEALEAGDYEVIATQSGVNNVNQAIAQATIEDATIPLNYNIIDIEPETCGNDGGFSFEVISGTAPYTYQILDENNNIVTSQENPTFSGLSTGTYKVRVEDNCGIGRVKEVEIGFIEKPTGYIKLFLFKGSCLLKIVVVLNGNADITNYSYELSFVDPITGETVNLTSNNTNFGVPVYDNNLVVNYTFRVINKCGVVYEGSRDIRHPNVEREITGYQNLIGTSDCDNSSFGFLITTVGVEPSTYSNISGIAFTQVPAGVDPNNIATSTGENVTVGSQSQPLESGNYKGTLITCMGQELPFEYNYQRSTGNYSLVAEKTHIWYSACGVKSQSFGFRGTVNIASVTAINSPVGSDFGLYKYNSYVEIYTYNYPPGDYDFEITNACGLKQTVTITVVPQDDFISGEVNVEYVCGGFNIKHLKKPSNPDLYSRYLQIYDENLGGWTTPKTDVVRELYTENDLANLYNAKGKAFYLNGSNKDAPNLVLEQNFQFNGKFRILERSRYFKYNKTGGNEYFYCAQVINEFEVTNNAIEIVAYGFACVDGNYTVGVTGKNGLEPYTYQIVKSPGTTSADNILVDNGTNHIFTDLSPGNYFFRAIDACGNFNTVEYNIVSLSIPNIVKDANCETQELALAVNGVDYLAFKWYKEGAESTVLSNTSQLDLGNITAANAGKYFVHITSNNPNACIDEILSVEVSPNPFEAPIAGKDFTVGPIIASSPINLIELIENNNSTVSLNGSTEFIFGQGQTAQNSGTLFNNVWDPATAKEGVYQFKYYVNGLCGEVDEAIITIINRNVCVKPPSTSPSANHPPVGISTLNRGDDTQSWLNSYNDGWIALESRTKGFVITRADDPNHPENTIETPVEGMLVFDIDENCLKLYDGTKWGCIYRGCDDVNP